MFGNPTEFGVRPERREPVEERSLALGVEGTLLLQLTLGTASTAPG